MKIIIPLQILQVVESKCPKMALRDHFHPKDLQQPLRDFIDTKLELLDEKLYSKYRHHRGTDERTLRFAWSQDGKQEDGAVPDLRNLLCYFGFGMNWSSTLKKLGITEENLIKNTRILKKEELEQTAPINTHNEETFPITSIAVGTKLAQYKLSQLNLTCCIFIDEYKVITAGFDKHVYIIDTQNCTCSRLAISNSIIRSVLKLTSTVYLFGCDDGDIVAFRFPEFTYRKIASSDTSIFSLHKSNRENRILTGERNGKLKEWEVSNLTNLTTPTIFPELILSRELGQHLGGCFMVSCKSEESSLCHSVGGLGSFSTINLKTGQKSSDSFTDLPLYSIDEANGSIAIGAGSGMVFLIRNNEVETFEAHSDTIRTIKLSQSGNWLLTGSKDNCVKVRNVTTSASWLLLKTIGYIYEIRLDQTQSKLCIADGTGILSVLSFGQDMDLFTPQALEDFIVNIKKES